MTRSWTLTIAAAFAVAAFIGSGSAADAQQPPPKRVVQPKVVGPRVVAPHFHKPVQRRIQINRGVSGPHVPRNVQIMRKNQNIQVNRRIAPVVGANVGMKAIPPRALGRTVIHGRNYSVWRGGPYRKRYHGGWRTFVALSTLAAITVGASAYYPYAYIDAPADYCEGLTEDGCQLRWAEVPTLEGYPAYQCVAYCPWQ
jgi:hypothetical protein